MALLIIYPDMELKPYVEVLLNLDPQLDIRIWPQIGNADDIEFAIDADLPFPKNIIILQVRPESVWSKKEKKKKTKVKKDAMSRIVDQLVTGTKFE